MITLTHFVFLCVCMRSHVYKLVHTLQDSVRASLLIFCLKTGHLLDRVYRASHPLFHFLFVILLHVFINHSERFQLWGGAIAQSLC